MYNALIKQELLHSKVFVPQKLHISICVLGVFARLKNIVILLQFGRQTEESHRIGEDLYTQMEEESFPGKGQVRSSEEELIALRKELNHVRQERDILRKAVAIFSVPQGKGTNL